MEDTNEKGWFANALSQVAKTLNSFILIFKKHGFLYSLIILVIFTCFYTLLINPIRIDKIVEKSIENAYTENKQKENEEKQIAILRRIEANNIIGDISAKLIDKYSTGSTGIRRVLILEAHNSIKTLQNIDLLYYSCSSEMLSPHARHLVYLSEDLQRQMQMNLIGINMINTLKHRNYLFYDRMSECQHPEHRLIHKLSSTGDNECIIIPFLSETNYPVILLVISGDNLPVNDIVEYVNEFKKQIENCLM